MACQRGSFCLCESGVSGISDYSFVKILATGKLWDWLFKSLDLLGLKKIKLKMWVN